MTKRFDKAFRAEAVRLALSTGKSIAQTARELGITGPTLYSWINQTKQETESITVTDDKLNNVQLIDELNRLRKENARLTEEREILKKAAAFFAKEEQKR
jgi:transposase